MGCKHDYFVINNIRVDAELNTPALNSFLSFFSYVFLQNISCGYPELLGTLFLQTP
jgi:hypothetical protein